MFVADVFIKHDDTAGHNAWRKQIKHGFGGTVDVAIDVDKTYRPIMPLQEHRQGEYRFLRLSLPKTKKHDQPMVTMPAAVGIYQRLLKEAKARGCGRPNDYLFMPELAKRRDHALRHLAFLFNWILEETRLKLGPKGQNRSLYCLRHTAITFRLLYGQGVDMLNLAKNARTSVEMIERHYASTLNGEMNIRFAAQQAY